MLRISLVVALLVMAAPAASRAQVSSKVDTTNVVDLADLRRPGAIERRLRHMIADHESELERVVRHGVTRRGAFQLAKDDSLAEHLLVIRGDANIHGRLLGNLVTLDGDVIVHPGGSVAGDILALNGKVRGEGGHIGGTVRTLSLPTASSDAPPEVSESQRTGRRLAGTIGTFLTLLGLGIALVTFARPRLELVADTTSHSTGRSLAAGFVGQILVLPTFGVLVVGLIVSVVGILLLPFVVVGYVLLAAAGVVGGYLAAAHALGEAYTRRRLAEGAAGSANSYRTLALGLGVFAAPWFAWALFGWVPFAGALLWLVAFLVTCSAVTVGLGAVMLSRGGTRADFAGWER